MFSAKILGFFGYSYCRPVLLPRSVTRSISPEISSVAGLRSGIAAFIGASFSHGRSAFWAIHQEAASAGGIWLPGGVWVGCSVS
jgi:hypothetical protein